MNHQNGHSKLDKSKHYMTNGSYMKVKSIAECSPCSILQYFWPALSNYWSWKPIFSLSDSGGFKNIFCCNSKAGKYNQEMSHSQTADQPRAPGGRDT